MKKASAYAPANIALSKYWGKRQKELNLPSNGSLSISLGELGTHTEVTEAASDKIQLNGKDVPNEHPFAQKVWRFVALAVPERKENLCIKTRNTVPTAAGLASSASGFAALTLALNDYFALALDQKNLSILARQGSGSACRSLWHGFVKWQKGKKADGSDSYAYPLKSDWQALRIAVIDVNSEEKKISSTDGMNHTMQTSPLFPAWTEQAERDLQGIEDAITQQDFSTLGQLSEANAMMMHATMIAARPGFSYWQAESLLLLQKIKNLRSQGLEIYATMDAGPNVKILYTSKDEGAMRNLFPKAIFLNPFAVVKE